MMNVDDQSWTRAILNSSYDAFIAIDAEGRVIDWNPQAEKTFGWKKAEVLSTLLHDSIIPLRHREAHVRGMKHYFATGKGPVLNRRIEIEAVNREGIEIPVELIIYPVRQGERTVFGAFLHDISERKRASQLQQAQLAITEILSEAQTLDEAAPALLERICSSLNWRAAEFWMVDEPVDRARCKSIWVSGDELRAFEVESKSMAFRRDEGLVGRVWATGEPELVVDVSQDSGFVRGESAARGGLTGALAFPIRVESQIAGVMCFYVAGSDTPDTQLLELISDVGRRVAHFIMRRRAEEKLASLNKDLERRVEERTAELALANEQLRSANRMKDEFLATVSHELRTPLNVMQGHAELLLGEELDETMRLSAEAIHRNAKVQGHIISDLLDVSRIVSGKLELEAKPINLSAVVEASLESIDVAAKSKGISVAMTMDRRAGLISGDFHRLQQVIWNLLTNAVKFTPKDGAIEVSLKNVESKAELTVRDNGKGIEADFIPHVFERFRQEDSSTTRHFGGLGLGLAIARHIVEAHGGQVEVASQGKDRGTMFTVRLPLLALTTSSATGADSKAIHQASKSEGLVGTRILIVEDQEDARTMLQSVLRRAGADAVAVETSAAALALLHSGNQRFDLILSDIGMPDEDGYAFIKKVRGDSRTKDIPAIALTAYAHPSDRDLAIEAGFQSHLSKPVTAAALLAALQRLRI